MSEHLDTDLRAILAGTRHLLFDGGMGTMLQAAGLAAGELPELLNLSDPDAITAIHAAYVAAGSEVVTTNTFGANALKLKDAASVEEIFSAGVRCARASGARYVAADIGPLGTLMRPMGTLSFDEAYRLFAQQVRAAVDAGADLFVIETMTDLAEIRAAVLAARENSELPIFATMTFEEDGRTFLGTSPEAAAITLDALGADVVGINCSLGPAELRPLARRMLAVTDKPVMVQANAGLPRTEGGRTVYDIDPEAYAAAVADMVDDGVAVIGGCCGTTPDYIGLLADLIANRAPAPRAVERALTVTSAQSVVTLPRSSRRIAVIGERINPTGKKRLQQALRDGDVDYVVGQGISQQEQGADILDVNVGLPDIDEVEMLPRICEQLSASTLLPLQIDSTDPRAIEAAVRRYAGKPIINSVNGTRESLDAVLPIAAHYGANIIGLTLDEAGIPATAEQRAAIAERIVDEAARYGIGRERILIDCLVMTASTNQAQALEILRAVTLVRERLGVACTLGVSNISFGLPAREVLNATFLSAAFGAGLDAPIMNPGSERYMDAVRAFRVLNAEDEGSTAYIDHFAGWTDPYKAGVSSIAGAAAPRPAVDTESGDAIRRLILTGRKGEMAAATEKLLETTDALELINRRFIPALDEVGVLFEQGTYFLPQLMASAEAARVGFDTIRAHMGSGTIADKGAICLATVKGDIHDIGKNIVKMLLDNYGFTVFDLGRDVDPNEIVKTVKERRIRLVGLSALMTTTVKNMEETIRLLRAEVPDIKVLVGGAVLTPEYAARIGADYYAKDAAETARIAEEVLGGRRS
ncbi:homocysteine S-methyltransferase family protein [Collinsella ihumii]|uniref:homocysteine S-methyltransferase family protein n=1 Tax=Collinsella ihumii TaxID=1720204 RepID=UPI0025AA9531|nr:homocysteine S-methyltransferase family protein [Collinsella ihumii]MDN0055794.1 homocysteine S-methyltransferase family protein [Collinsella ihumii]